MRFAQRVTARRKELGISQQRLAALVGRHQAMVSRIEAGESRPDLADALLIARALDMNLDDLLEP